MKATIVEKLRAEQFKSQNRYTPRGQVARADDSFVVVNTARANAAPRVQSASNGIEQEQSGKWVRISIRILFNFPGYAQVF